VLTEWNETAPTDAKTVVYGFHILKRDKSTSFDLYADASGNLIGDDALAAFGVRKKNWDLRPRETLAETPTGTAKASPPAPVAISSSSVMASAATVELPAVDVAAALHEDEEDEGAVGKGVTRLGVFNAPQQAISVSGASTTLGAWTVLDDGSRVWTAIFHSPDAKGIRLHFASFNLPSGAQVLVYNTNDLSERYGPYLAPHSGEADIWVATCFSDSVAVECSVPAQAVLEEVHFDIDNAVHIYRGFDTAQWAKSAGSCNLDVTCYEAWQTTSHGVAGLGTIGTTGYVWCTGSLIVDTNTSTDIPFVLTANHCVRAQTGYRSASSLEVYWLYQTSTCKGTAPSAASVPRTSSGADYLAGASGTGTSGGGNDFTFLRLREAVPSGLTYLGWSTVGPSVGTAVVCIHHPSSDYKRISFANLADLASFYPALFHEVRYTAGTTEGGSSGAPLMLESTGQIIGQLWGGSASCNLLSEPDYYGRFDVTFPIVQSYLDPYSTDPDVGFDVAKRTVSEDSVSITVTVNLSRMPGEKATVNYAVTGGTAVNGVDYTMVNGAFSFDGTIATHEFTIALSDDRKTEPDKTIVLSLSNPVNCNLSNTTGSMTITIADDDPDTDGDGLSDYEEINATYGYVTDIDNPDTDSDGYSDYEEEMGSYGIKSNPTQFNHLSALSVPYFHEASIISATR
jgi:hypothetical protein